MPTAFHMRTVNLHNAWRYNKYKPIWYKYRGAHVHTSIISVLKRSLPKFSVSNIIPIEIDHE